MLFYQLHWCGKQCEDFVIYSIMFLVAFQGNVTASCVYSFKMRPWKNPVLIHYSASGEHWIFNQFLCKFVHFGFRFDLYSSIFFLACFGSFCYMVFVQSMKFFHMQRKQWTMVACQLFGWSLFQLSVLPTCWSPQKWHRTDHALTSTALRTWAQSGGTTGCWPAWLPSCPCWWWLCATHSLYTPWIMGPTQTKRSHTCCHLLGGLLCVLVPLPYLSGASCWTMVVSSQLVTCRSKSSLPISSLGHWLHSTHMAIYCFMSQLGVTSSRPWSLFQGVSGANTSSSLRTTITWPSQKSH